MDGNSVFQMVAGLGDGFSKGYETARARALEDEAPGRISDLLGLLDKGGAAPTGGSFADGLANSYRASGLPSAPAPVAPSAAAPAPVGFGPVPTFARIEGAAPTAGIKSFVDKTTERYGLDPNFLPQLVKIESGSNPGAFNKGSKASGLTQFIPSTAKAYGLTDPFNPEANLDAAGRLTIDNRNTLRKALGRDPTNGELYLGHQQGAGGASKLLANPQARAADIVGLRAVTANGGTPEMTAGEFARKWIGKFDGPTATGSVPAARADAAPAPQGFPGFGAGSTPTRLTPELKDALNAAWRNPHTRSVAASVFSQMLKGGDSPWEMKDVNGQSSWVNGRTGQVLPIGAAARKTATVGDNLVDQNTGEVIFTAPARDSDKLTTLSPGSTLFDPKSRQPVFTAPRAEPVEKDEGAKVAAQIDARKKAAPGLGLLEGTPAWQSFVGTGKLGRDTDLSATDKKAIQEADEGVLSAQNAVEALNQAKTLSPKAYEGIAASMRGYAGSLVGADGGVATEELKNVVTTNALGQLKAIFGGNPTEGERKILLDIQGSVSQPDVVRQKIFDRAIVLAKKRLEFNQRRADEMRGGTFYKPDAVAGSDASGLPKGEARVAIPEGQSAGMALSEAKRALKARPDLKAQLQERLRSWGIDPARLDQ